MCDKKLTNEELKNVSGGVSAGASEIKGIFGMENFDTEQKKCRKCGGNKLIYKTFLADDGVTTKIGQLCENCGDAWTFGNKTGIK